MNYKTLPKECFESAKSKGLWDHKDIHQHVTHTLCEVSEMFNAITLKRVANYSKFDHIKSKSERFKYFELNHKDSIEDEASDILISLASMAGFLDINIGIMINTHSDLITAVALDQENGFILLNRLSNMISSIGDQFYQLHFQKSLVARKINGCIALINTISTYYNIDLEYHVKNKMWYNELRPHFHGKK